MSKLSTVFICLYLVSMISLVACASGEPALPSEAIEKIKGKLGYALAPTYLPKGFEYDPGMENPRSASTSTVQEIYQIFYKVVSLEEMVHLAMIYPLTAATLTSFEKRLGLEVPEDAISEIDINGITAYLFHGSWSIDTLRRIAQLELPINPKWDYDGGISIRFAIDVPDNERVWVSIKTVFPTDEVTGKDLIRIARSVVVIE